MTHAADLFVERLKRIDACGLSDALDKLGLQGVVTGLSALSSTQRVAGRVHTVKLIAAEDVPPSTGPPRHLGAAAIEASTRGEVIVVEQRTGRDAGCWGGLLSLGAKMRGVAGIIADGSVRDIDEARELDFPIFARGCTARTARNRVAESGTDVPITIGDVEVQLGDYVLADSSAVVFVRSDDIGRVLEAAEAIVAREAAMSKALLANCPITEVMGVNYEHMLKR